MSPLRQKLESLLARNLSDREARLVERIDVVEMKGVVSEMKESMGEVPSEMMLKEHLARRLLGVEQGPSQTMTNALDHLSSSDLYRRLCEDLVEEYLRSGVSDP